jgi:hypothetical protein
MIWIVIGIFLVLVMALSVYSFIIADDSNDDDKSYDPHSG